MDTKTASRRKNRGARIGNLEGLQRSVDRLNDVLLENSCYDDCQITNKPSMELVTLQQLFKRFYAARVTAGAAPRTLRDYEVHFSFLTRFLEANYSGLKTVLPNREVIRAWIMHMLTVQKLKPSTVNIRLRTMKAMFNWAVKEKIMRETPFENVDLLRVPVEDFKVISKVQERKLFDQCDLHTWIGIRDALLMSFLLESGVRIGECLRLQREEINLNERSALIRAESAKSRKARTVYFGIRTQRILAVYLEWHDENANSTNLFLNEYGLPIDPDWAAKRISQLGKRAGITGVRVSPHTFRHTFATRYIQATGDPFSLRRLLGHSSMEMVNRYVNQTTSDVQAQYAKFLRG